MNRHQALRVSTTILFLLSLLCGTAAAIGKKEASAKALTRVSGAEVYFDEQSGTFDYWIFYRQLRGDGGYIEYTIKKNDVSFSDSSYFIPIPVMVGQSGQDCKYAPAAFKLRVDPGRSVFKGRKDRCNRSYFGLGGKPTTTNWKYCDKNEYISCSFWRCKCKGEGSVDVVVYDGSGNITDPGKSGLNQVCSPPF